MGIDGGSGDEGEETVRTIRSDETPSEAVVEAITSARGVEAPEFDPPLYRSVDPDALDNIFRDGSTGDARYVRFRHAGFVVTLRADGTVVVAEASVDPLDADSAAGSAVEGE